MKYAYGRKPSCASYYILGRFCLPPITCDRTSKASPSKHSPTRRLPVRQTAHGVLRERVPLPEDANARKSLADTKARSQSGFILNHDAKTSFFGHQPGKQIVFGSKNLHPCRGKAEGSIFCREA